MARKTFFSFHYQRDSWRVGQVRNCNLIPNEDEHGYIDAVDWEKLERQGDAAIRNWIDGQLEGTSATVLLIGAQTASRPWVRYEIIESWNRGNAIVGIRIHGIKDSGSQTDTVGANPLDSILMENGQPLSSVFRTYDWVTEDGRNNMGGWIEAAVNSRAALINPGKIAQIVTATAPKISDPPRQWA